MAIVDGHEADPTAQLWALITQLSEQLSQNQSMSVSLYTMAGKIKVSLSRSHYGDDNPNSIHLAPSDQLADRICFAKVSPHDIVCGLRVITGVAMVQV
jgi:hypothetical protein